MTNHEIVADQPCNLISKGIFNTLFPEDLIVFDKQTGSFKINK